MVSDQKPLNPPLPAASLSRACAKVRLRFRKSGDLRLVSHRDLMKFFERALRRADLPIHVSQGFHPMPRMVFALSLGLGIIGLDEVLELELTQTLAAEEVKARLSAQMPPGLEIASVRSIPTTASAQVHRAGYRISIPTERMLDLPERIDAFLATKECWIERDRPTRRRLDLRPYVSEILINNQQVEMLLWVTPQGAARPGEVLAQLGLEDLVTSGVPLERHVLEIHDEIHHSGPLPAGPGSSAEPQHVLEPAGGPRVSADKTVRPTALISGPLNFDS